VSRIHRLRRRAGHAASVHERARTLAATQLTEPIKAVDATWLLEHLAGCEACRAVLASYEADRAGLRLLRDHQPQPPRDLWARTSAAIEREAVAAGRAPRRATTSPQPASRRRLAPMAMVAGVAIVVVVVGASLVSGGFLSSRPNVADIPQSQPPVAVASSLTSPGPTPLAVGAGAVGWIGAGANGKLAYNESEAIDEVCAVERQADCAPVADQGSKAVDITVRPKSVTRSPVRNEAVVMGTDSSGSDSVVVIALPTTAPTPPAASPSPVATPAVTATAIATATPSTEPTASPVETPSESEPPASETPSASPVETPIATPTASAQPSATPTVSPEPTIATSLAIASNVKIVGESAAFSPDGTWFAFTARPSDDSTGPDIYVWRVGDAKARKLTDDHVSVFASWADDQLIGSRPMGTGAQPAEVSARSFLIDPVTVAETELDGSAWRPVLDPSGQWAVTWDGTVRLADNGLSITPATGTLAVRPYTSGVGIGGGTTGSVVTDSAVPEFDARWDETGTWLAIWLADPNDPTIGRLSLHHLDRTTGKIERVHGAPKDVAALPGFSIGDGRLAWATPPGQGGEGSRVQVVAWSNDNVGTVESGPVENVVVIH
jgi:WD40-like Beta Propeller Repeat